MSKETFEVVLLMRAVKKLNSSPNTVCFKEMGDFIFPLIFSTIPPEELILPINFCYDEENGITNKNSTKTDHSISVQVQQI